MNGQKKAENDLVYELFHLEMAVMPKSSRILLNLRFFASNTLHSFCNLAVILINFLAKNGLTNP